MRIDVSIGSSRQLWTWIAIDSFDVHVVTRVYGAVWLDRSLPSTRHAEINDTCTRSNSHWCTFIIQEYLWTAKMDARVSVRSDENSNAGRSTGFVSRKISLWKLACQSDAGSKKKAREREMEGKVFHSYRGMNQRERTINDRNSEIYVVERRRERESEREEKNKLIETISDRPVVLAEHQPSPLDWRFEVHSCVISLLPVTKTIHTRKYRIELPFFFHQNCFGQLINRSSVLERSVV